VNEAINLVKQKAEILSETHPHAPFPEIPPTFEIKEFDFPDYLNTSTIRFYEDGLIESQKSLVEDDVTKIEYKRLSGKTTVIRMSNGNWVVLGFQWLATVIVVETLILFFFLDMGRGHPLVANIFAAAAGLFIPLIILNYIKTPALLFYDRKNSVIFWARYTKKNKEKLDQVVHFIQERVTFYKSEES
jgi:hypothetical protein